jgi:hypothetical protein
MRTLSARAVALVLLLACTGAARADALAASLGLRASLDLTWVPLDAASPPGPRAAFAMAFDEASRRVVLFGGFDDTSYLADTWFY